MTSARPRAETQEILNPAVGRGRRSAPASSVLLDRCCQRAHFMLTHCNLTIVYNRDITCLIRSVSPKLPAMLTCRSAPTSSPKCLSGEVRGRTPNTRTMLITPHAMLSRTHITRRNTSKRTVSTNPNTLRQSRQRDLAGLVEIEETKERAHAGSTSSSADAMPDVCKFPGIPK